MGKRVALYARVSTDGQTCENQLAELRKVADSAGWEVVAEYVDSGVSGSKGRDERPQFDALCRDAVRRQFAMVATWGIDRLGRSLQDLVAFLNEMRDTGIDLYVHKQAVDTTTPSGRLMFQMVGAFAEFERAMIRERVCAGLERAKAGGKTLGRPKLSREKESAILRHRSQGWGRRRIARAVGCAEGTVKRVIRDAEGGGLVG